MFTPHTEMGDNRQNTLSFGESIGIMKSALPRNGGRMLNTVHGRQSLLPQRAGRPFRLLNEAHVKGISAPTANSPFRDRTENSRFLSRSSGVYAIQHLPSGSQGKDPRPIRDRSWQNEAIKAIANTIIALGYNDSLMMAKTFQPPSSKEFQSIFRFIYYQIDPMCASMKRFEDEFITILKNLRYPFVDQISKSHLYSVGSMMSWPSLLGALLWMVELVTFLSEANKRIDSLDPEVNFEESKPENMFFNYLTKAYALFLTGNDDYEKIDSEFMETISRKNNSTEKEIENLRRANEMLENEWNELSEGETPLSILKAELSILEADKEKLKQSMMSLKAKKESMSLKTNSIVQHIELHEARLSEFKKEESRLRETIEAQQILASDVKLMNSQKEQIQRSIDKTVSQIEKVNKESWDQEVLIQKAQDQISGHKQELLRLSPRISELNSVFGLVSRNSHTSTHIPTDHYMRPDSLQSPEDLVNFTQIMNTCKDDILNCIQDKIRLINDSKLRFEKIEWKNASLRSEIKDLENAIAEFNRKYNEEQSVIGRLNDTKSKEIEFYKHEVARARTDLHEISINHFSRLQAANNSYASLKSEFARIRSYCFFLISGLIDKAGEVRERDDSKISSFLEELQKSGQNVE